MTNSVLKKIAALLTAFALVAGVAYAGCISCEGDTFIQEMTSTGCCEHDQMTGHFQPKTTDCCSGSGCDDVELEKKALARRSAEVKAPEMAALVAEPFTPAVDTPQSYTPEVNRQSLPAPPDRTYLQHCSFLC